MKITAEIKQHDKYQLEMKFTCPFHAIKRINDSHIDVFFFLPRSLSINEDTYQSSDFYKDFSEYVRFKTPTVKLEDLADPEEPTLKRLSAAVQALPTSENNCIRHLKMFCAIAKSTLRDTESMLEELPSEQRLDGIRTFIRDIGSLLERYRALRPDMKLSPKAAKVFLAVDEFLSITSNAYLFSFWKFIQKTDAYEIPEIKLAIAAATGKEILYREKAGFPSAKTSGSGLLYREGVLKKAMGDILFLKVDTRKDGVFLENLLMGLGAAVAMIFVTAISFLWKGLFLEEFSASFFIVWVVAYMFKDRIKSLLQLFCTRHRSRYTYDYRQKIFDDFGRKIGTFREGFRFCRHRDLDHKVIDFRDSILNPQMHEALHDSIMLYRKKIELRGDAARGIIREFKVNGVVNIYRLNIRSWTCKMDNPARTVFTSDGTEILPIRARKEYHVNMILRYGVAHGKDQYTCCRLVIGRNGIRRIEYLQDKTASTLWAKGSLDSIFTAKTGQPVPEDTQEILTEE